MLFDTDDSNCSSSGCHVIRSSSSNINNNSYVSRTKKIFQENESFSHARKTRCNKSRKPIFEKKSKFVLESAIDEAVKYTFEEGSKRGDYILF